MLRNRRRVLELALVLLSICAARSDDQPLDHGLSNERDPEDPSPAMEEFFGARPAAPIPAAGNWTDPVWGVSGKVSPAPPVSDGRRKLLLVAGVVCGAVGVGFILAAAGYRLLLVRRTGQPTGPGSVVSSSWSRSCREIRLGAA